MILFGAGLLLFLLSALLAAAAVPLLDGPARALGLVDRPGGRKDHRRVTPLVGGPAVLSSTLLLLGGGLLLASAPTAAGSLLPEEIARHLPGIRARGPAVLAILLGALLLAGVGLIDDRRGLSPWVRLLFQLAAAAGLLVADLRITLFLDSEAASAGLTLLFVVFLVNATNFIDNMNGLLAGVTALSALGLAAIGAGTGQLFTAALGLVIAGAQVGFLPFNFPTARAFTGDGGSTAVGFLLAATAIATDFHVGGPALDPIVLPSLLLLVPFADGMTVVVARLRRGVHPFTAGHDHLSHRLVARGLSRRRAVLLLWCVAALGAALAVSLADGDRAVRAAVFALALPVLAWGWRGRGREART